MVTLQSAQRHTGLTDPFYLIFIPPSHISGRVTVFFFVFCMYGYGFLSRGLILHGCSATSQTCLLLVGGRGQPQG